MRPNRGDVVDTSSYPDHKLRFNATANLGEATKTGCILATWNSEP